MKKQIFILSAIISSCILTIAWNQSTGQELHPRMPTGGSEQPCYPASKCTGNPNVIGGQSGQDNQQSGNYSQQPSNYQGSNTYYGTSYSGSANPPGSSKVLQTESTDNFEGVVQNVDRVPLPNQTAQIQMVVSTQKGDMLVIVGPASYIDQAKVKIQAGDKVVIKGYRINANGQEVIVAAQIDKNGNTLQLLDENRTPVWGPTPGMQGSGSNMPAQSYRRSYNQYNQYGQYGR